MGWGHSSVITVSVMQAGALSSKPSNSHRKQDLAMYTWNPSFGRSGVESIRSLEFVHQPAESMCFRFMKTPFLKIIYICMSTCALTTTYHTFTQYHTHTKKYKTKINYSFIEWLTYFKVFLIRKIENVGSEVELGLVGW